MTYKKSYGKKQKEIVVKFNEQGDANFEGFGFEGNECIHEMQPFEQALTDDVGPIKPKPEMHQKALNTNKQVKKTTA